MTEIDYSRIVGLDTGVKTDFVDSVMSTQIAQVVNIPQTNSNSRKRHLSMPEETSQIHLSPKKPKTDRVSAKAWRNINGIQSKGKRHEHLKDNKKVESSQVDAIQLPVKEKDASAIPTVRGGNSDKGVCTVRVRQFNDSKVCDNKSRN